MKTEMPKIVKSRETGKTYRVVREYKNQLLVAPAWKSTGRRSHCRALRSHNEGKP